MICTWMPQTLWPKLTSGSPYLTCIFQRLRSRFNSRSRGLPPLIHVSLCFRLNCANLFCRTFSPRHKCRPIVNQRSSMLNDPSISKWAQSMAWRLVLLWEAAHRCTLVVDKKSMLYPKYHLVISLVDICRSQCCYIRATAPCPSVSIRSILH